MFGILRPCRHSLPGGLAQEWMSHLCGLCLALRDGYGQVSRLATNHDGLVISVLTAAQSRDQDRTRGAGPCPLRGMRTARIADGSGAHLAASVSLMLAAAKISDHIEDGDGPLARPGARTVAGRVARRWRGRARTSGADLGFDTAVLAAVVDRQREVERDAASGTDPLLVTAPTEEATAEAFAHTALLAGRPANAEPLREAGRLFGRIAHLLDAVEDQERDRAQGAWNPLTVTGTTPERARGLCEDAAWGVSLALTETEFTDDRLVRALLVTELRRAIERTFAHAGHGFPPAPHGPNQGGHHHDGSWHHSHHGRHVHGGSGGDGGHGPTPGSGESGRCSPCSCQTPALTEPPRPRGLFAGCAAALFMCCTCQFCCRDPHPGPWTGEPRESWCQACECLGDTCGGCCGACDHCKGCSCCKDCSCCD